MAFPEFLLTDDSPPCPAAIGSLLWIWLILKTFSYQPHSCWRFI